MLRTTTNPLPYAHRLLSPLRTFHPTPTSLSTTRFRSSATLAMSTTVEHLVLFHAKPDSTPTQVDAMLSHLRSLSSLPLVSHLTAAPILNHRSSAASAFSHLLHSRYPSKDALAAYSDHPDHVAVVKGFVLPTCDDIMAFDFVSDLEGSVELAAGKAVRVTLVKTKEGVGEREKGEILAVLKGVKGDLGGVGIEQVSLGENFSPARAKGYSLGVIAVFPDVVELEKLDGMSEALERKKEKVRDLIESVIVLDFVVPAAAPASL